MAKEAPKLFLTQDIVPHVYGLSIALFVIMGVYLWIALAVDQLFKECSAIPIISHGLGLTIVFSLSIASIVLFSKNLGNFASIDIDNLMAFVKDEKCSEGPLQVSFDNAYDSLIYERMLNRLALGFVASALGA